MKILILIFFTLLISSCVVGPKQEDKSVLNRLNGENYTGNSMILQHPVGVLAVKGKNPRTKISGICYLSQEGQFDFPLKYKTLSLFQKDKKISETRTDGQGHFLFSEFLINGEYIIKIEDSKYKAHKLVTVKTYEISDINIFAKKR